LDAPRIRRNGNGPIIGATAANLREPLSGLLGALGKAGTPSAPRSPMVLTEYVFAARFRRRASWLLWVGTCGARRGALCRAAIAAIVTLFARGA
jgi:hypothetical protein